MQLLPLLCPMCRNELELYIADDRCWYECSNHECEIYFSPKLHHFDERHARLHMRAILDEMALYTD